MNDIKPGTHANGYVWNGSQWVPEAQMPKPAPPMTAKQKRTGLLVIAGIGAALLVLLVAAVRLGWVKPSPADYTDDVWRACKDQVTAQLKAPSTADFPWRSDVNVVKTGELTYSVVAFVDAENSFGANVRTTFRCTASVSGGRVSAVAVLS